MNEVPRKSERGVRARRKSKIPLINAVEVEARSVIGILGIVNGKLGIIGNGIGIDEIVILGIGGKWNIDKDF